MSLAWGQQWQRIAWGVQTWQSIPIHYTALPSPVAHTLTNLPSKVIGSPASASGHSCLARTGLCMLDGASPKGRREVLALHCQVHTHRVLLTGTFPSCSVKNLGCNFAWMQGTYSVMSVCWALSKLGFCHGGRYVNNRAPGTHKALRTEKSAVGHTECCYCCKFSQCALNKNDHLYI